MMALSVLSVIGIVLKWILFVLLGIIGLVLLILLIVIFDPFFYKLKGFKDQEQIEAHARVFWLFHLIRVEVDFVDKKLVWKVKVAWKQIAGSDMVSEKDEEAYHQHGELEIEPAEGENVFSLEAGETAGEALPKKAEKPKSEEAQLLSTLTEEWKERIRMAEDETYAREQREKAKEEKRRAKAEKAAEKQRLKDAAEREKLKKQREAEKARKAALENGEGGNLSDRIDQGIGKLEALYEKVWDIIDAILDAPDKIEETLEEKLGPIEKYMRMYDRYPRKSETINAIFKLLGDILRPLVPKRYQIDLHFGSGDPYNTAKLIGIWYAIAPMLFPKQTRRNRIEVKTEMEEKVLDFTADIRGHFSIATVLVGPIIAALCNRDIRRLIRFVWKLKKKKDAEAKKAEEAAAKEAEAAEAEEAKAAEAAKASEPAAVVKQTETVNQTDK